MNFKNLTVSARLSAAFGSLVVIVLIVSTLSIRALSEGHDDYANYVNETSARVTLANDILDATNARAVAARNLVLVSSAADHDAEKSAVTRAHEKVGESLRKLKAAVASARNATDRERQLLAAIDSAESRYGPVALDIVNLALSDKKDEAIGRMNDECRPLLAELLKASNEYIAYEAGVAVAEVQGAEAAYLMNRNLMLGASALAVALAVLLAFTIARSLTRALGGEPAEVKLAADAVARGDLAFQIELRNGDTDSVMAAMKAMSINLRQIVHGVRLNAESVATASSEISQGNSDLSSRTEEQASALEETAASMEELQSTVKQNADNASQANQLAQSASTAAHKGGAVVGEVVGTMKQIEDASRQIVDIISVIDGIAFQTNILALNAAVEAARAGEQGRGFAVVAGEVRTLAQRSAEAAKQIKTLISANAERVEAGSQLVAQAGDSMSEIVQGIQRVTDIMGEITAASREQSSGISQVAEAMSQMDQTTQQNAALVEESAAAAESLKQQAQQLLQAVSVFKLEQVSSAGLNFQPASTEVVPALRAANVKPLGNARRSLAASNAATHNPSPVPRKTGTDDEWTNF